MKEKKMVACVVLGVSLVSLITVLVAAFAQSIEWFVNYENNKYGGVTLGAVLLGIVFVAVFFANKKHRFAVNLGLAIAVVAYCVVSLIALGCGRRSVDDGYLASALTLMVSCALTFAAWLYLTVIKKKEEGVPAEEESKE